MNEVVTTMGSINKCEPVAPAEDKRVVIDEYSAEGGARIRVRRPGFYY